jgi:hypothetical protein
MNNSEEELNKIIESGVQWANSHGAESSTIEGDGVVAFSFETPVELEKRDKNREVCFFIEKTPDVSITVDGGLATTFQMGELVIVKSTAVNFSVQFELVKGNGDFVGHIMPGNRPGLANKEENRFNAFDWQIFLRTLRRDLSCQIRATFKLLRE